MIANQQRQQQMFAAHMTVAQMQCLQPCLRKGSFRFRMQFYFPNAFTSLAQMEFPPSFGNLYRKQPFP